MLLQVRLSRGAGSAAAAVRLYRLAGGVLVVSCELLASTTEWSVSFSLSRDEIRGRYLAFFSMGSGLQQAVGPAVVTALITAVGGWDWLALAFALGGAGALGAAIAGRAGARINAG